MRLVERDIQNSSVLNGKPYISRRDFLKLSGTGLAFALLPEVRIVSDETSVENIEQNMRNIDGIDVYGLESSINQQAELDGLANYFNDMFDKQLEWHELPDSLWEQREKHMPKNERHMQLVVKRSVYDSYADRKNETGVDFVEYSKLMLDSMNRELMNCNPPIELNNLLKRIIVVDDSFESNPVMYTKDIDAMWFFDYDNRHLGDGNAIGEGSFWSIKEIDGDEVVLTNPAGSTYGREVVLRGENDALAESTEGVWIDYGMVHEFKHQMWNVPDEYDFDFNGVNSLYKNFRFDNGYFMEPTVSPYTAMLIRRNIKLGIRGYYMDRRGIGTAKTMKEKYNFFGVMPKSASIEIRGGTAESVYRSRAVLPDYYDNKQSGVACKRMEKIMDLSGRSDSLVLTNTDFAPDIVEDEGIYPVLFRINTLHNNNPDELYLPLAVFNMSAMGGVENPKYNIEYTGRDVPDGYSSQVMKIVDNESIVEFEKDNLVYAKMKIDGTASWAIWSFQY